LCKEIGRHATIVHDGQQRSCVGLARTIYIRFIYSIFGREITKKYGHIRCIYTVLANPNHVTCKERVVTECLAQSAWLLIFDLT